MKIIFSHGQESGPWGTKIRYLAEIARALGYAVDSLDYRGLATPEQRISHLLQQLENEPDEVILAGSSMGAYVALMATGQYHARGVFLLAPALFMPGYEHLDYPQPANLSIVHGWSDEIIPVGHAIRYAQQARCNLHLIDGDHRLIEALPLLGELFRLYLQRLAR